MHHSGTTVSLSCRRLLISLPFICVYCLAPPNREGVWISACQCHSTADKCAGQSERMLLYTLIGGYMLTSVILFKYPTLLHKKKRVKFMCQHISHRGGESSTRRRYLPPPPQTPLFTSLDLFILACDYDRCDMMRVWVSFLCEMSLIFAVCDTLFRSGRELWEHDVRI